MKIVYLLFSFTYLFLLACSLPYMAAVLLKEPTPVITASRSITETVTPSQSDTSITPSLTPIPPTASPSETPTTVQETATPILPPWTPSNSQPTYASQLILVEPWLTAPPYPVGTPNRTRPTYRWSAVPGAEQYALWVWLLDKYDQKKELVINQRHLASSICSSTECSVKPQVTLIEGRKYAWQVQAYGDEGSSPLSSLFTFIALGITETPGPTATITPTSTSGTATPTPFIATAISPINIIPYPTLSYARSVHVISDKNILLIGDNDSLKLFSLDPYDPQLISQIDGLQNPINDIETVLGLNGEDYAFLAAYDFYEVDITDIDNPTIISLSPNWDQSIYGKALGVLYHRNYLYVAADTKGVRILDPIPGVISDKGSFTAPSNAYGLGAYQGYMQNVKQNIYIAASSKGLRIRPLYDGSIKNETSACDTPGSAYNVAVGSYDNDISQYVFVADFQGGIRVLDISSDNACVEKTWFNTQGYAMDVKLLCESWAAPSSPNGITNFAYVANRNNFLILDITNPLKPKPYAIYPNANVMDIALDVVAGGIVTIYAAAGQDGILIFEQNLNDLNIEYINSYCRNP